jgi:hypothetical protein
MDGRSKGVGILAAVAALVLLCGARAEDAKPGKAIKAEDFKGKTVTLKEGGKASCTLTFSAGQKAKITVKSDKKTDVNLFVKNADGKVVAKDDSPGPDCDLTFTPKEAGNYTLEVVNKGPGENKSTLKVSVAK